MVTGFFAPDPFVGPEQGAGDDFFRQSRRDATVICQGGLVIAGLGNAAQAAVFIAGRNRSPHRTVQPRPASLVLPDRLPVRRRGQLRRVLHRQHTVRARQLLDAAPVTPDDEVRRLHHGQVEKAVQVRARTLVVPGLFQGANGSCLKPGAGCALLNLGGNARAGAPGEQQPAGASYHCLVCIRTQVVTLYCCRQRACRPVNLPKTRLLPQRREWNKQAGL